MGKTFKACGATGLADALASALASRLPYSKAPKNKRQPVAVETWVDEAPEIPFELLKTMLPPPIRTGVFISGGVPDPVEEKRKREENAKRITKLSAIIKRSEPRLFMEVLQSFGSIEGLNARKQAELIARLEGIRKEYNL